MLLWKPTEGGTNLKYRVVRILTYTYNSVDDMVTDRLRWTHSKQTNTMEMRSAVVDLELMEDSDDA